MTPKQQTLIASSFSKQTIPPALYNDGGRRITVLPKPSIMQVQKQLHQPSFFIDKAAKRPSIQQQQGSEREKYLTGAIELRRTREFCNFLGRSSSSSSCQSESEQKERSSLNGSSSGRMFYDYLGIESNPKHGELLDSKRKRKEFDKENNIEVSTDLKLSLHDPINYQAKRDQFDQPQGSFSKDRNCWNCLWS